MTLYTCGYLQTRMDVVKLWKVIFVELFGWHLTALSVFIGKGVEQVSGVSLFARLRGPEGLY